MNSPAAAMATTDMGLPQTAGGTESATPEIRSRLDTMIFPVSPDAHCGADELDGKPARLEHLTVGPRGKPAQMGVIHDSGVAASTLAALQHEQQKWETQPRSRHPASCSACQRSVDKPHPNWGIHRFCLKSYFLITRAGEPTATE